MKILTMLFLLTGVFALDSLADDRDLAIDAELPKIGNEWIRRDDWGALGDYSWVNFDSKNRIGEVLSFVSWRVPPTVRVRGGPVAQASIEMFLSTGSARFSGLKRGQPIRDTVRHRVVSIQIGTSDLKRDVEMIEYSYVYEGDGASAGTIAHGYCFVVGGTALFVQHTSPKVISSELAFEMAGGLLSRRFQLTGKAHSISKGKTLQDNG